MLYALYLANNVLCINHLVEKDTLRLFLDCLDFSEDLRFSSSWPFLVFLMQYEQDDFFTFIDTNEGRQVNPKFDSDCVWLVKIFTSQHGEG